MLKFDLKKYCSANSTPRRPRKTAPLPAPSLKDKQTGSRQLMVPDCEVDMEDEKFKKLAKKAMEVYDRNLEFYRANELKLEHVLLMDLRDKNYLQSKKIFQFFKNRGAVHFRKAASFLIFQEELKVFTSFLSEHYQRKIMKEISITCDSIKEEQKVISNITNIDEYDAIYDQLELKTSKARNFDFISQYQHICNSYGMPDTGVKPHLRIKLHLEKAKEKITAIFERTHQQKEHRRFIIKTRSKLHESFI